MSETLSNWDQFLAAFSDPEQRDATLAWVNSRPPAIRDLVHRHPPGSTFMLRGRPAYVISYQEVDDGPPGLNVSYIDPSTDYDRAMASKLFICGEHLPEARR
jgi:hypothetical protein